MPQAVSLQEYVHGDTWRGIAVGPVTVNGSPPTYPCTKVVIGFGQLANWPACAHLLSTDPGADDGTITIDDAVTWEFTVIPQLLPLDPGDWDWQMRFTDSSGAVTTYFGGTLSVVKNVPPAEASS